MRQGDAYQKARGLNLMAQNGLTDSSGLSRVLHHRQASRTEGLVTNGNVRTRETNRRPQL